MWDYFERKNKGQLAIRAKSNFSICLDTKVDDFFLNKIDKITI